MRIYSFIAPLLLSLASAQASGPEQILGMWLTPNGESRIKISKCGELYCGTIAWMRNPKNDVNNSDPALKGRPLTGVQIASGFRFDGGNSFSGGKLYGPERGKTVEAKIVVNGDSIDVKVSVGVVKKTVTWTREK